MPEPSVKAALRGCRSALLALFIFGVAINLLVLASPLYMMQIYDRVLSSRSTETLLMLTVIVLFALAVMSTLEYCRTRIMTRIGEWLDKSLGSEVLGTTVRAASHQANDRTALPLRDLSALRDFLTGPVLFPILDAPWVPLFLFVLYALHPLLAGVAAVGAVLLFSLALASELLTRKRQAAAASVAQRAQYRADASVRNADVVQAMGMLPALVRQWSTINAEASGLKSSTNDLAGAITAVSRFVRISLQSVILGVGAWLVIQGEISGGAIIGGSIIMGRALAPVEQAIAGWRVLLAARAAWRRLNTLLSLSTLPAKAVRLPTPRGALKVEGVVFGPPGAREPTIRNIGFELTAGDALMIIGPSAAGKSTLAKLLVGTWTPARGAVRLDGAELASWDPVQLGAHIGYLPQDVELFAGTVRDNIARMAEGKDELVVEAAQAAQAHEMILKMPNGYSTEIGDGGMFLSGGQRQRIGLARALYGKPCLLVLDEPNAGLDSAAENHLLTTLVGLKKAGSTLVVISHQIRIMNIVDKVLVLNNGAIERFGPRDEIVAALTRAVAPPPQGPSQPGAVAAWPGNRPGLGVAAGTPGGQQER